MQRILGIDVARALAVIGMIIVNFKVVFGSEGAAWAKTVTALFEGKAAATFVVLAGVGIALMSNSAIRNNDLEKLRTARGRLLKRAGLLFVIGLSYMPIWPADILHFYGIYMLLAYLLIDVKRNGILAVAITLIAIYPVLMLIWDYESGWNFKSFTYLDFWTLSGFFRNLFFNGFHPVIPWAAFMLIGLWYGKQNLNDDAFIKRSLKWSLGVYISTQLFSYLAIRLLSGSEPGGVEELSLLIGTSPMPPLPVYMISGSSLAIFVISASILIAKKYPGNRIIKALNVTGQLALTFYVAHVVIGMGLVEAFGRQSFGSYTAEFSLYYALIFSTCCVLFALVWAKFKQTCPLEWLIRKLTA